MVTPSSVERSPKESKGPGCPRISPDYFRSAGIPLVRGRGLEESDREGAVAVTVINDTIARRFFAGEDPIGRRILATDDETWLTVVGVAGDCPLFLYDFLNKLDEVGRLASGYQIGRHFFRYTRTLLDRLPPHRVAMGG